MSGTYDSAVSKFLSRDKKKKQNKHESKNLLLECIARLPPLAIFTQSLVICVIISCYFIYLTPDYYKTPFFCPVKGR